jgi:hypothetical protein
MCIKCIENSKVYVKKGWVKLILFFIFQSVGISKCWATL